MGVTDRRLRSMSIKVVWAARTTASAMLPDSKSMTFDPSTAQTSPQGPGVQGMKSDVLIVQVFSNFSTRSAGTDARILPAVSFTAPAYSLSFIPLNSILACNGI